jgi:DNA topoisomerase-3
MHDIAFRPRNGGHDDGAHPPIHPTKCVEPNTLSEEERKIYDLVTRHFLACCGRDAQGSQTEICVAIPASAGAAGERFTATGLMILERNWLEVYPFEHWNAKRVPVLRVGDTFRPKTLLMSESTTSAPEPITESDLIAIMDRNGIGTDATIATHIATIQAREYASKDNLGRFIPTKLGLALVEGYNSMGLQLNKPHLRAAIERDCQLVAKGQKNKNEVVKRTLEQMRGHFVTCTSEASKLDVAM